MTRRPIPESKARVWVVEARFDGAGWTPTVGIALNRRDGRYGLDDWRTRNPDDRFRLRAYAPVPRRKR